MGKMPEAQNFLIPPRMFYLHHNVEAKLKIVSLSYFVISEIDT